MKVSFRKIRLSPENKQRLQQINDIIVEYQQQGYKLTLRQLYYQLVSRDVIPNRQSEYAKLSKVLVEGRMAGQVDWAAIEDRLRVAEKPSSWDSPVEIMDTVINQYEKPRMKGQANYLEVWVEKDALSGVLSVITEKYHVPILVNRGYSSVSAIYDSYKRFRVALESGQSVKIIYLGDYDPSGMDMIRDVTERPLEMLLSKSSFINDIFDKWVDEEHDGDQRYAFGELQDEYEHHKDCYETDDEGIEAFDSLRAFIKKRFEVIPVALTRDQITQYKPPPNPAKKTDPRAKKFIKKHGSQSWEVDALRPEVLNTLLEGAIVSMIDVKKYKDVLKEEKTDIKKLELLKTQL